MQVVILCDQEIGVKEILLFFNFIMIPCFFHAHLIFHNSLFTMIFHGFSMVCFLNYMIPCFSVLFHAHLIFHNSLYHGFPCFFHGLVFKLYDTMLSMLFPCFNKIRKHGNSMEKQGNHGFHAFSTRVPKRSYSPRLTVYIGK